MEGIIEKFGASWLVEGDYKEVLWRLVSGGD